MKSRVIAATAVLAAALTLGLTISASAPAAAQTITPSVQSSVVDAGTTTTWSGSEITGAAAQDTAMISGTILGPPTGDLTYTLFNGSGCTGTPISTQDVPLNPDGTVPDSSATTALAGGPYSFQAVYDGDVNYFASPPSCESFTVNTAPSSINTTVFDAATNAGWSGSETTGATAYDTASIGNTIGGFTPTGTVTYDYFGRGTCSGSVVSSDTETLKSDGSVPQSKPTQGTLGGGTYYFEASYSGDGNYAPSGPSGCEPFTVGTATSSITTTVFDAATKAAWNGSETTGSSAYDTASIGGTIGGFTPTGSVTYDYYGGGTCAGPVLKSDTKTLNPDGTVPPSPSQGPLGAGTYYFDASYGGDGNYAPAGPSGCESFSIGLPMTTTHATVFDAATKAAWNGSETTGSSAYDTASIGGTIGGFTPTGSVSYDYYGGGTCAGPVVESDTEPLNPDGTLPPSPSQGPLGAGTHYFSASYSGDGNYAGSTSSCESFTVVKATSSIATTVFDAATNAAWNGSEATSSSAYDTASIGGIIGGFTPTGSVTYDYYGGGTCAGPVVESDTEPLNPDGTLPPSPSQGPLGTGTYYFSASYSGDGNYAGSTSSCESFTVVKATSFIATTVFDAATNAAWSGNEVTGATAKDTASVIGVTGFIPTGTVTYHFFAGDGTCTGGIVPQTVTIVAGSVPDSNSSSTLSAGTYSFDATYSGDGNYAPSSSSGCESFTVKKATPSVTTTVFDAATNAAWSGSEVTGATAYDTAAIGGTVGGIPPTGSVTYHFFVGAGNCTGSDIAQTVTLTAASVPNSNTSSHLASGPYSFDTTYSGDGNYAPSGTSICESFAVNKATPSITTTVFDAATNAAWSGSEFPNASAYDTATVVGATGVTPTGTVTYDYYGTMACTGSPVASDTETVNADGTVPHSTTQGPLSVAVYHFDASYSGDGNYVPSGPSGCETFGFGRKSPSTPLVSNIPTNAQYGSSFLANVNTTGDGVKTVTSSTPSFCTVANGLTVSFVGVGTCTLTAHVALSTDYFPGDGAAQSFVVGRAFSSAPSITNLPFNPIAEGGFTATVSTNGDGTRSIVSSTARVCTVSNGLTVSYVAAGSCTLTALVAQGPTHFGATGSPQTFTILPVPHGYWLVGSDGGIFTFGDSQFWGSTGNLQLQRPVVGITPTVSRNGYWLVASDGGIFSFGDAGFYGSIPGLGLHPAGSGAAPSLNAPIVAMVPSTTGHGYFMVASDGGVFAFGDARFAGSCPGIGGCSGAAVAVVPDSTGNGYWLFTNTGNVYTFGDAPYYGAPPATVVPVTSAVATPDGHGYWILFSNGEVASFGDAPGLGSPVGYTNSANPATTIFPTANGGGYWVGSARGDVFAFGDAPFLGSMAGTPLNGMIIAASGY